MTYNLNILLPEIFLSISIFVILLLGVFFKKSEKINKPYHELRYVINNISKLTNLNDITLQSFRSNSSYINELKLAYKIVKKEIEKINLKI